MPFAQQPRVCFFDGLSLRLPHWARLAGAAATGLRAVLLRAVLLRAVLLRAVLLRALLLGAALALVAYGSPARGQLPQLPQLESAEYSTEQGLPSNLVKGGTFDAQGFLWLATDGGAVRFDGVDAIRAKDSSGQFITNGKAIQTLSDGRLLLAADTGVWVMSFENGQALGKRLPGLPEKRSAKLVFEETSGALWIGGESDLYRIKDGETTQIAMPQESISRSMVRSYQMTALPDGRLLVAANPGQLYVWSQAEQRFTQLLADGPALAVDVSTLKTLSDGSLWAGDREGVVRLSLSSTAYRIEQRWSLPLVTSLTEMPWGLVAGSVRGLFALAFSKSQVEASQTLQRFGPNDLNTVQQVLAGPRGELFVASDNGVVMLRPQPFDHLLTFPQKSIQSVARHGPDVAVLVGSEVEDGAAIHLYRRAADGAATSSVLTPMIAGAHSIETHRGWLWVLSSSGLLHAFDGQGKKMRTLNLPLRGAAGSVLASCGDDLWVGFDNWQTPFVLRIDARDGIQRLGPDEGVAATPRFVRCAGGQLMMGVHAPTSPLLALQGGRFQPWMDKALRQAGITEINDLAQMADGRWILASSTGLWQLQAGQLTRLDRRHESDSEFIRALAIDQANQVIWFGTNSGVAYLDGERTAVFRRAEGIANPTVSYRSMVFDPTGGLWVAHFRGLARLSPFFRLGKTPPPMLTPLHDIADAVPFGSGLLVTARAPAYPASFNQYQYRLNGGPWRDQNSLSPIALSELPAGPNRLEVRGGRGGAIWSDVVGLDFKVARPWYLNAYFLAWMVLVGLITLFLAVQAARQLRARLSAEASLRENAVALQAKNQRISDLLNHVRQGIFSVNRELQVGSEFSAACLTLLNQNPAGAQVDELLCPSDPQQRAHWRNCLADAMAEPDPLRRDLFLSLLPNSVRVGERHLSPDYVPLSNGIMIALTDTTEQAVLQQRLEQERRRLELIVCAISDSAEFFDLIDEFRGFVAGGTGPWAGERLDDLYRQVHTFKGSFSQLGFDALPRALHEAEEALRHPIEASRRAAALAAVFSHDWLGKLESDLAALRAALGDEFVASGGVLTLKPHQAELIEQLAREQLARTPDAPSGLRELALIRHVSLQADLRRFDTLAQRVASDLDKQVMPLQVHGDAVWLEPRRFRPLLSCLGHLIRNAIDHGIEDPVVRTQRGKPAAGTIACHIRHTGDALVVEIQDDGTGIDEAALRERAQAQPELRALRDAPLSALVFAQGLSSREDTTAISGRGVGMAALAAQVRALGGEIDITSTAGQGTTVRLTLPAAQGVIRVQ
jgi:ligand-binding sensor domain-containing protein/signal transduction histidine kinase